MIIKKILPAIMMLVLAVAAVNFGMQAYKGFQAERQRKLLFEKRKAAWQALEKKIASDIKSFDGEVSLVIKDLATGLEISFDKDKAIQSASLVKVPIMAAVFYAESEGRLKLDEKMTHIRAQTVPGSGVLKSEKPGKSYTIKELMDLMISESDNTAANMLMEKLGMDYLDKSFKRMGLKNTNISRVMMDFKSRKMGVENYTTASDMAYLLEKIYRGKLINPLVSKECLTILARQKVKDRIPKKLPPGTVVAHKTGLERGVCHDAGIVYTKKGNFLIVALTRHKSKTSKDAKAFIAGISLDVYNWYDGLV
ncbi:MAG: class A beta-lactamase-related serine hydrolase [Candidatus Omnitrophica bacterium]|nr:class A beta-lactamase-related serine hydrolase [Candidatus Omnitrophota bacterium]